MKSLTKTLIVLLLIIVLTNGYYIKEDQENEDNKSSIDDRSYIERFYRRLKVGVKKIGNSVRNSFNYVKDHLTPTPKEVESSTDRGLFIAPCRGTTDDKGKCRSSP